MKFIVSTCIAAAALAPLLANALPPGQYIVGEVQEICLVGDGTWYGTTFANWGGAYVVKGSKTLIYGNYLGGVGNDSMVFYPNNRGPWTEWRDDLSYQDASSESIRFLKTECDPPAAAMENQGKNPRDAR